MQGFRGTPNIVGELNTERKTAYGREDDSEAETKVGVSALRSSHPLTQGIYAAETPFRGCGG